MSNLKPRITHLVRAETEVVQDPELMAAVDSLETIASAEGSMDFGADELVLDAGRFDRQPSASESNRVREALDALVDFVTAAPTLSACYGGRPSPYTPRDSPPQP